MTKLGLLAALTMTSMAMADTVTYSLPANSKNPLDASQPVDAQAIVTTGDGTVELQLFNLLTAAQMQSAGQLVSDFFFTLSGTFDPVTNSNEDTPTGTLVWLNGGSGGTVGKWGFSISGTTADTTTFHADGIVGDANTQASQTLIGGTAGEAASDYTNAGSSLTVDSHNPFVQGNETFLFHIAGVTSDTDILGGVFSFTTDSGHNITGIPNEPLPQVPEPRTTALLLFGVAGMAFAFHRKVAAKSRS